MNKYKKLLSSITVNGIEIPNRVIMGRYGRRQFGCAMSTPFCSIHTGLEDKESDFPTLARYFAERASVGLIVTGGVAPNVAGGFL